MKAFWVREGSKENGTQVTGRQSPALQALLWEMVKNLLTGLWLAIQNCAQEPIRKNSPGVDHAQETGTDPLESTLKT